MSHTIDYKNLKMMYQMFGNKFSTINYKSFPRFDEGLILEIAEHLFS